MIDLLSHISDNYLFGSSSQQKGDFPWHHVMNLVIPILPAIGIYFLKSQQLSELLTLNESQQRLIERLTQKFEALTGKSKALQEKIDVLYKQRLEYLKEKTTTLQNDNHPATKQKIEEIHNTDKVQEPSKMAHSSETKNKEARLNVGIDLVELLRKKPGTYSLKGREKDLERLKIAVGKAETPNAILVGPAGSGKTTLVEAWADEIAHNSDPNYPFANTVIISISASDILSNASYVGVTEGRVKKLIEYGRDNPNVIYFIDELHSLMVDGSSSTNGIPNMLKAALSNGDIKIIGCTTNSEFKLIENDQAFTRRFSFIDFKAPSDEMIREMIAAKIQNQYSKHHEVTYEDGVIHAALAYTRSLPGNDPAKTLSLLDAAGSLAHLRGLNRVTVEILESAKQA